MPVRTSGDRPLSCCRFVLNVIRKGLSGSVRPFDLDQDIKDLRLELRRAGHGAPLGCQNDTFRSTYQDPRNSTKTSGLGYNGLRMTCRRGPK